MTMNETSNVIYPKHLFVLYHQITPRKMKGWLSVKFLLIKAALPNTFSGDIFRI